MTNGVNIIKSEVLSDNWYTLRKFTFDMHYKNGKVKTLNREAYDRGNGATILLYNKQQQTVVLTRQFRLPTFVNGNESGMLIESCAGLLDKDNAEDCIRRETEEETGFRLHDVKKIYEAYMSPGSVTEILYFFVAEYNDDHKINEGGGIDHENIEVMELDFKAALAMVKSGEIKDAKTIMLLQYIELQKLCNSTGALAQITQL